MRENPLCPGCGTPGKTVKALTLESLVSSATRATLGDLQAFHYCATATCALTYFHADGRGVEVSALLVPPFDKSEDPERLVCFCFEHRLSTIRAEVEATGDSVVPGEIAARCKAGLDRCEELNPRGSCCLGQVRAVVKEARRACADPGEASRIEHDDPEAHDCCAVSDGKSDAPSGDLSADSGPDFRSEGT